MWIDWDVAAVMAAVLAVATLLLRPATGRGRALVRATTRELAVVLTLYAIWQWAHDLAITEVAGAHEHALWVWDVERWFHIGTELRLQHEVLLHPLWTQFLNGYYAAVHVPALGAMLIWLFFRHRDRYPPIRNALALTTGSCLLVQTIPVAPPRMLTELGFVDTGLLYGQSVYGTGGSGISNQLAAMPSIHVAWCLVVMLAVLTISTSRWRWLVLVHLVLTMLAITATANHWWLDGIVAGALLMVALLVLRIVAAVTGWARTGEPAPPIERAEAEPAPEPAAV
jgi:hypothetical protein